MTTITRSALRDMLYGLRGTVPLTISALTRVNLPKKAGFAGDVFKLSRVNGLTGTNVVAARQRASPGYERHPRSWGERISPALVQGRNGVYLSIRVEHRLATVYLSRHGSFLKTMRENELPDILPKKESPIQVRDYALTSIKRIAIAGRRYRVVEDGSEMT